MNFIHWSHLEPLQEKGNIKDRKRAVSHRSSDSIPAGHKDLEAPENSIREVQIDFAELENGSLVDAIEAPTDPNHTLFAIFQRGRIRLAEKVEDRGRILVPIPRSTLGFSDVKIPQDRKSTR